MFNFDTTFLPYFSKPNYQCHFSIGIVVYMCCCRIRSFLLLWRCCWWWWLKGLLSRAGNLLIWFPSELLVFCPKMSKWAMRSKKWAIHSFLVSQMSNSLTSLISSERPEQITQGRSFLVSKMRNLLTSLIWFDRKERFIHIAHQKKSKKAKMSDSPIKKKKNI